MSASAAETTTTATPTYLVSRVHAVTVYKRGARVTRRAVLPSDLPIADHATSLRFDDLPLSLVDSSLRCRLLGTAGLRATEVQCELRLPEARQVAADTLEDEIRTCSLEVTRLSAQAAFVEESIGIGVQLGERGKAKPGSAPLASPLRARLATLEQLDSRLETLHKERAEVLEELRVVEQRLLEARAELAMASSDRQSRIQELRKSVVVAVQGTTPSPAGHIELEYFVPGARWAPSYALRLGANLQAGQVAMRAMVSQRSGEDWSGVDLTLSTADHQQWAELPELNSKRIGRRQPSPPKKGWRAPPLGTERLYRDYDASFGAPSAPPAPPASFGGFSGHEEPTVQRLAMPVAASLPLEEAAYADFDDEEEFEAKSTQVMESAEADYSEVYAAEDAPMPMASAAPAAPRRRESAKKKMAAPRQRMLSANLSVGGAAPGSARPAPPPSPPSPPSLDLELMQYARLRMQPPSIQGRGTLHIVSRMDVYAEVFVDSGTSLDGTTRQVLAAAESRAQGIAAMPSGHVQPWSEGFDYAYMSADTIDLASDGQFHSLPIVTAPAACTPLHVVVPRESTDVFRTVAVDNPLDAPLLAGPMDVYWDDAFLLTSSVAFTAPKGKVELGLGVDQAIKVVRNTHFREDTAGLMGGSLELSHKIVVQVANEGQHEIALEVRERIPVPATDEDDIKLDIKGVTPSWSEFEPLRTSAKSEAPKGMYRWQVNLAAGERTELSATYEIKLPSKYELSGGNRREW